MAGNGSVQDGYRAVGEALEVSPNTVGRWAHGASTKLATRIAINSLAKEHRIASPFADRPYTIVLDNDNGAMLQLGGAWGHYYDITDPEALRTFISDLDNYLAGEDVRDWDDNDPDALHDPERGYRVFSHYSQLDPNSDWASERAVAQALR
jgi:hypothetical protein